MSNILHFKRTSTKTVGEFTMSFQHEYLEDGTFWVRWCFTGEKYSDWFLVEVE